MELHNAPTILVICSWVEKRNARLSFHLSANGIVKGLVYLAHSVNECPTFNFVLLASVLRFNGKARISGSSFPPELAILQRLGVWTYYLLVVLHGR